MVQINDLDDLNKALSARWVGPAPPAGAILKPMDLIGHGPNAYPFSWDEDKDGEPVLMIEVTKESLQRDLEIWCSEVHLLNIKPI